MRSRSTDPETLLPTPLANLGSNGGPQSPEKRRAGGHSVSIEDAVHGLFPTPRASDGPKGAASAHARSAERLANGRATLPEAVALLPTPTADPDSGNGHARDLRGEVLDLLPTPNASLSGYDADPAAFEERRAAAAARYGNNGIGMPLGVAVQLLPTPTVGNGTGGNAQRGGDRADELLLPGIVVDGVEWGKYRAAVERAEAVTGIPAPAPAIPDGKGGKMRLHARFVEWMMMLLPGWVTGHGLTRQKELERLGNGVVPLQAAAATAVNLARLAEIRADIDAHNRQYWSGRWGTGRMSRDEVDRLHEAQAKRRARFLAGSA